jgi:hypothetical protein
MSGEVEIGLYSAILSYDTVSGLEGGHELDVASEKALRRVGDKKAEGKGKHGEWTVGSIDAPNFVAGGRG